MINIIRDNTKEEYYTKCKNCGSELSYIYDDVTIIPSPISYHTDKRITCPVCNKPTSAELMIKENYTDNGFSFKQSDEFISCISNPGFNSLKSNKQNLLYF